MARADPVSGKVVILPSLDNRSALTADLDDPEPIPRSSWIALLGTPAAHQLIPSPLHRLVALVVVLLLISKPTAHGGTVPRAAVEAFTGLPRSAVSDAVRELVARGVLVETQRENQPSFFCFVPEAIAHHKPPGHYLAGRSKG